MKYEVKDNELTDDFEEISPVDASEFIGNDASVVCYIVDCDVFKD